METKANGKSVYQILTEHIIGLLEKGTIPWKQPWGQKEPPQNLLNKIPYRGINMMLLSAFNFERNLFLTFKQIKDLAVSLKEGAKPLPVVFWKWPEPKSSPTGDEDSENGKLHPILRYYLVYNISMINNIPEKLIPVHSCTEKNPIESCTQIVDGMPNPPRIEFLDQAAYYIPSKDVINMPEMQCFDSSEGYYATLFHEMIHSTGHESRLNRKEGMENISFGSDAYSQEELVAEIGACFLEAYAGISAKNIQNNAAYINGWLSRLRKDSRFIVFASAQAQKAADFILRNQVQEVVVPSPNGVHPVSKTFPMSNSKSKRYESSRSVKKS